MNNYFFQYGKIGKEICGDIFPEDFPEIQSKYFVGFTYNVVISVRNWLEASDQLILETPDEVKRLLFPFVAQLCFNKDLRERARLRSYVDVGLATRVVDRLFAAIERQHSWLTERLPSLLNDLADDVPPGLAEATRTFKVLAGQKALQMGNPEFAVERAKEALSINAVCPDGQTLLYDALLDIRRTTGKEPVQDHISLDDLTDKFCMRPFTTLVTGHEGRSFLCDCPAYVPFESVNVLTDTGSEALWNSDAAAEIRRSVLDGDFSYCSRSMCGLIKDGLLPTKAEVKDKSLRAIIDNHQTKLAKGPQAVQLSHDQSCNLACPSCRTDIITLKGSEQAPYNDALENTVLPLLETTRGTVMVSGGGDPFGSKHYRNILSSLDPERFDALNICILTNALLLTPQQWQQFETAHPMIQSLLVSVDAADPETYADVRRPGDFSKLLQNLEFLSDMKRSGKLPFFGLCFVVQKKNYKEMPDFVSLAKSLGCDIVWFQRIVNFGSFTPVEILEADVVDDEHPLHQDYLNVLKDPRLEDPSVRFFGAFQADRAWVPDMMEDHIKRSAEAKAERTRYEQAARVSS